jgi:glycosyltransferase involved in cell wall biosynthesis
VRVLIDYRPALRNRSGAGEYTHQLTAALLAAFPRSGAAGVDVTVFSSSWKDRLETFGLNGAHTIDRRVPGRVLNLAWHRLEWPPIETMTGLDFEIAHSSHPLLLPARRAAQIVTIHDLHFLTHPERTRGEIHRDYPALVRDHARRAARILVPSRFTAREVEHRLGVATNRIAICPPGAPDWKPREPPATDGYILFFSTIEPRKNVGGLLDAYERLIADGAPRPPLVLAGKAAADVRPVLERLARPPLAGRVRHIGYVDPADRQALYAGARLLILPSFDEGFGIPVLEAMTAGVPVVASERGSLPEVLGDAGPLVNPDDSDDIAAGIARVLDDAVYASVCAAKGVIRSREFNWNRTAHLVHEAYRQAIEERELSGSPTR